MSLGAIKSKIQEANSLIAKTKEWKSNGLKVVFTNGCFDILHRGHIAYLAESASLGDKFIVAVNSDESVKTLGKGDVRPLQDEYSRALIIASLGFVDAVIVFNESTPFKIISMLKPDVLVKGGDYDENETNPISKKFIVGSDVVKRLKGQVKVIPFLPGYSTSKIEQKIKNSK